MAKEGGDAGTPLDTETEENKKTTDEHQLESEKMLMKLKRDKRVRKSEMTKIRHHMEKLCLAPKDISAIEKDIEHLWSLLESTQEALDELCVVYLERGDVKNQKAAMEESQSPEWEIQTAIEKAHEAMKAQAQISFAAISTTAASASQANQASLTNTTVVEDQPNSVSPLRQRTDSAEGPSGNSPGGFTANHRLKPLKVPTFDGDNTVFEEFWGLFQSLVDQSNEPVNLKMAKLRQSLTGIALESIRGLGVSEPEYKEAKEILESKFGGQRRQLRAYMDQLEKMAQLRSSYVRAFERFADLLRITVVKLQTEGRQGELGEGTLHSLLVKKFADSRVERDSRWLREQNRERSVVSLKDWLKEEVRIRVEAVEMSYSLESEVKNDGTELRNMAQERIKTRTFWTALDNSSRSQEQSD